MLRIWLNQLGGIKSYKLLKKYNYNISSVDDSEIIDLWDKVNRAYSEIERKQFIYQTKFVDDSKQIDLMVEFFKNLYGKETITTELEYLLELVVYRKGNKDYKFTTAEIERRNEIGSTEILAISVERYQDILTADLLVHEISHALYSTPVEYLYNETISITFEKIFANAHHFDLENLNSITSLRNANYDGELEVKEGNFQEMVKCAEKLYAKTYLIGYVTSLYLFEKYKNDPEVFKKLINKYKYNLNASKEILKYYSFNFKSEEVDSLLDKDIQRIKKRMYS